VGIFYAIIGRQFAVAPETIVFFRAAVALFVLLGVLATRRPDWLRIQWRDLPLFVGQGAIGIAAFYLSYVYAVHLAGASVAAVLMYTAPVWVTLYARRFLGERFDRHTLLSLAGALVGAAMVAQVYHPAQFRITLTGVAFGLASGVCYACYSIFNKQALRRYSPWTVLTFGFICGLPFLALSQQASEIRHVLSTPRALLWLVALGTGPTLGGGLLYAAGLARMPASTASIIVAFEPAVATVLAFVILGERPGLGQMLGAAMIIVSILALARRDVRQKQPGHRSEEVQLSEGDAQLC
jgi:drug/metabolite transporter (DMT)-like permease